MKKLIVDTNIFIKGIFFHNKYFHCKTILDLVKSDGYDLVFSQETIGELMYVVKNFIKYSNVDNKDDCSALVEISKLFYNGISVNTLNTVIEKCDDEFDDMFIKCFVESNADYIITDDFKSGMDKIKNINVISSLDFIRKEISEVAFGKHDRK